MRTLGAFNMSVGTSMALEKDAVDEITRTNAVLVNLRTLVRNVIQSYAPDDIVDIDTVVKDSKSDLREMARWLADATPRRSLVFTVYYPSYKSLPSIFSKADLVTNETRREKARKQNTLLEKACEALCREFPKQIIKTDSVPPKFDGKGLIITHHVVDLALTNSSTRLKLLESYTGTAKPYTKWYTKLTGGKDLFFMPFNKLTIQIFGDKATNFYSSSLGLKKLIEDLATGKNWNAGTSYTKVRSDINGLPNGIVKAGLRLLL